MSLHSIRTFRCLEYGGINEATRNQKCDQKKVTEFFIGEIKMRSQKMTRFKPEQTTKEK